MQRERLVLPEFGNCSLEHPIPHRSSDQSQQASSNAVDGELAHQRGYPSERPRCAALPVGIEGRRTEIHRHLNAKSKMGVKR